MVTDELMKAIDDGTAKSIPPRNPQLNRMIPVMLTPETAEKLQREAARQGMRDETYASKLIEKALEGAA